MSETMNIVLTNWKAAFQKEGRSLLLMAIMLSGCGFVMWATGAFDSQAVGLFFWCFLFAGLGPTNQRMQQDIIKKPLSFCLPGYRESLRRLILSDATIMGLGLSLLFGSLGRNVTWAETCLNMAGGLLAGIVLSLWFVAPRLILSRPAFDALCIAAIPLAIIGVVAFLALFEAPLVVWPVLMIVFTIVCAWVWIRLGDMRCIRRGQRIVLEDAIGRRPLLEPPKMPLRLERWFLLQVECQSYLHIGRYVWADVYATFGPIFRYWKWILGLLVVITLVLGYAAQWGANILFTALGAAAWTLRTPLTSTMLLPGGRRERCHAAVATGVAASLLLVAAALAVVALSWFFALFLGETPTEGQWLSYAAIHPGSALLACLLVPWFLALRLLGYKVRFLNRIDWIVFMAVIVLLSPIMPAIQTWSDGTRYMVLGGVLVGGWLCFLLVLRLAAHHWSIGGQR